MTNTQKYSVANYMLSGVVTIDQDATLRAAIGKLLETKTNSLVVVDAAGRVVGMLSTIDVVKYVVPDYLEEDRHLAAFEAGDVFVQRVKEIADQPVKKSMSSNVHTIQPSHTLIEAAALLSEHRINQLPVVDDAGKAIGYIGRTNIKQAIHDVLASES